MMPTSIPSGQRLRLSLVPWEAYVAFCDGLGPRHIRMTYDRGEFEIMALSSTHEHEKCRLRRFVDGLSEEMEIDIAGYGSMTMRRADLQQAIEPDECYWVEHEPIVRRRNDIDLLRDPPADLALEVEIDQSTMDRMALYAAMKVQEVWRWDGRRLRIYLLSANATYVERERGKAFPFVSADDLMPFLLRTGVSDTQLSLSFRKWVRERMA